MDTQDFTAPEPAFEPAFEMRIDFGDTHHVGHIATGGARSCRPVAGGAFAGEGFSGSLVGGSETLLHRADGVTSVEAEYYIAFVGGDVVHAFGKGYEVLHNGSRDLRCTLLFEADEQGALAALATRAFIAERREGASDTIIYRIV